MTSEFNIVEITSFTEYERYGLREFASEFGHQPIGLPIHLWFYKGDLVAYVEVRNLPVLYPAVAHGISPRVFLGGGQALCEMMKSHYANGFVIYDRRSAQFAESQMERLGFTKSPLAFYEVTQEKDDGSQSTESTQVQSA